MKIEPHQMVIIFALLFALLALLMWRAMRRWTKDDSTFDIRDLFMENGKASAIKFWLNGSYIATTWAFVYMMLTGKGDGQTMLAYGGLWITPLIGRMFKDAAVAVTAPAPPAGAPQ